MFDRISGRNSGACLTLSQRLAGGKPGLKTGSAAVLQDEHRAPRLPRSLNAFHDRL